MAVEPIPPFDRQFFGSTDLCTRIGTGAVGGKAQGLLDARFVIEHLSLDATWGIEVRIPRMIVVTTSVFDDFLTRNALAEVIASATSDERLADAFCRASLPTEWLGDFRAIVEEVHIPLAVRSSSLLEDAMHRPFAGVYATKMIPNDQPDADTRFHHLMEAVKFVYASTFFRGSRPIPAGRGRGTRREDGGADSGSDRDPERRTLLSHRLRRGEVVQLLS